MIKLAALSILKQSNKGGATEDNNQNFSRGSPTDFFQIFNQFRQLKQTTKILQEVTPSSIFSPTTVLQNQSQLLLVLKKKKALPEGGQELNYKYGTD